MYNLKYCAAVLLFSIVTAHAQQTKDTIQQLDEVVVTATKFEIKKELVGKIIFKLNEKDIKNLKGLTVADALENFAGISVNGVNSAAGKNKSTFIRGGRDRHVLVLINGFPVSDPSGIYATFDLRFLNLNQVESIEVMNGAAGTLYGSGAATGVISIKLKESAKRKTVFNYQVAAGTNNSNYNSKFKLNDFEQFGSISGTLKNFTYAASINSSKTNGMSEAFDASLFDSYEKDDFKATNTLLQLGYKLNSKFNVNVFSNFNKNTYDYDAGSFSDSEINNGKNQQFLVGLKSNYNFSKGVFSFLASVNNIDRNFESFNSWTNAIDFFEYTGKTVNLEGFSTFKFGSTLQIIGGISHQYQSNQTNSPYGNIDSDLANYSITDPYFNLVFNSKSGFNLSVGSRLSNHSTYGTHWAYNFNPSYNFSSKFRIFSSVSTAFIAPSAYQLFSQYGNTNLKPEEDLSFESGLQFKLGNIIDVSSLFFYREEQNTIILPTFVTYENALGTINAKGLESDIKITPSNYFALRLGHAYTYKSSDIDYIPKHKFNAVLETNSFKNIYASLKFKTISKRTYFDEWGTGENINLKAYSLVDLYSSVPIFKNKAQLFMQISNIFNEKYEEIIGYTTKGRNVKFGLTVNL